MEPVRNSGRAASLGSGRGQSGLSLSCRVQVSRGPEGDGRAETWRDELVFARSRRSDGREKGALDLGAQRTPCDRTNSRFLFNLSSASERRLTPWPGTPSSPPLPYHALNGLEAAVGDAGAESPFTQISGRPLDFRRTGSRTMEISTDVRARERRKRGNGEFLESR